MDKKLDGVHVRAVLKSSETTSAQLLEIQIWPLPDDKAMLEELSNAIRETTSRVLSGRGTTNGAAVDISAKGRAQ